MKRKASAIWHGGLTDGRGTLSTQSGVLSEAAYSYAKRFENQPGTNPEELIAAAHAGCFSMALSSELQNAGLVPKWIETEATLSLEKSAEGFAITGVQLEVTASVPGSDPQQFLAAAQKAKAGCPVSKLLKAPITMNALLQPEAVHSI